MRFYQTLLAGAALIASVVAQKPTIDTYPNSVTAGNTVEITYSPSTATAKFVLRKGLSTDLDTVATLTESATGGKFSWSVPKSLVNANDYALQIIVNGQENYSGLFAVTGGSASSASASASSSASASRSGSTSLSLTTSVASSSASGSISSSASSNSTITRPTLSTASGSGSVRPTGGASQTTSSGPPQNTNGAASLSSPFALFFGAAAAFAFLQ